MYSTPSQNRAKQQFMYVLAFTALLLLGFATFTYLFLAPLPALASQLQSPNTVEAVQSKLKGSSRIMNFTENEEYQSLDHQYDHLWGVELLAANGGFFVADKELHNSDHRGISMFHQLHCLSMIRDEVQHLHKVIDATKNGETVEDIHVHGGHKRDIDSGRPKHHDQMHTMHCFDYIRQSLLCLADGTVEYPKPFDNGDPHIDGMGERQCKDWTILFDEADKSSQKPLFEKSHHDHDHGH